MDPLTEDLFASVEEAAAPEYEDLGRAEYLERIDGEGCKPVYPADNQLQIDLDSEEAYKIHQDLYSLALKFMPNRMLPITVEEHFSRSGPPHRHITITCGNHYFHEGERIVWQAALGSDPKRELMSLLRIEHNVLNPTMFTEVK